MADSYSVQAVLSVKDKNFTSTMKSAQSTLSSLDSSATKSSSSVGALGTAFAVAQQVVSSACNVIMSSVQDAVARVDTLNQYPKIMEQMGFSSEEAEKSIQKLSDGIQGLPTSLDSIVSSTQSIAILTGDLDLATDTALALNDAFLASGSSTAEAERGLTQYVQMLSSGKVDMQSWKTLQETMGYALSETAKQLGITSGNTQELYSALQSGSITFDEFNAAIIECDTCTGGFAETASIACEGIATSWENVKTAVVRGVANMIEAWNEAAADNGLPTIQESLHTLQNVCDTVFNACAAAITVFVNNLDLIVAAAAPVVTAIAGFKIAQTAAGWFDKFKDSGKKAADALNNYSQTSEKAKTATENVKVAEEAAKGAMDDYQKATQNVINKEKDLNTAREKRNEAAKKVEEAEKKVASSTEDSETASAELEAAEKELEATEKQVAEAAKAVDDAEKEKSTTYDQVTAATQTAADAQEAEAAAIEGTTLKAIAQNAIMAVLSGSMSVGEAAVKAFNAAWDANPIGLVTTAITTLISVVSAVITVLKKFGVIEDSARKQAKEFKEEVEELTDSIEENRDSMEDNTKSAKNHSNSVKDLCTKITDLAAKENKSAEDTSLLRTYIDQLNDSVEGLGLAYDETTDSLNMSIAAMNAAANVDNKAEEYAAAQENYNTALEDYLALGDKLEEAQAQEAEMGDAAVLAKHKQKAAIEELEDAQAEQAEVLEQALNDMQAAEDAYTTAQGESCALRAQALAESVANQTVTLDQLTEENQATVETLQATYSDYVDAATNMFDTLDTEVTLSVQDMIDNMVANQNAMAEWGNNCESLRDRFAGLGLDTAVLDQLVDLGPEGAGYIQALTEASDTELALLEHDYERGGAAAWEAMNSSMGEGASEVMKQAENLITQTADTLTATVEKTDWTSTGESIPQGVAKGVEAGAEELFSSVDELGNTSITRFGTSIGFGSPAAEFVPAGESIPEGVAKGINSSNAAVEAAEQMAETVIEAATEALSEADFSGPVDSMCSSIASATTNGMSQVSAAVTKGMDNATEALTSGFKSMASATTSNMDTIRTNVTTGMNTIQTTIQTTINTIKSNVQTVLSNIKSNITSEMNNIKTTITSTMNTIQSTVTSDLNSIKSTVSSAMSSIKSTVSSAMSSIKSTVSSGMDSIKSTISSAMSSCVSSVSSAMSSIKSSFSSGMNSCVSTARSTCSSITSAFSGLYSSMYSAGANAMSGLQAGLNSRSGSVISTARSIANSVTSTINSALKVGSPSKVLTDTGEDAGQGLVNGLKNMISDVKNVAVQMADAVTDMVFGSFDAPNLAFEGGMTMSYYFDDGIMDALDDLTDAIYEDSQKPINVTVYSELDGREIAKGTAQYMQDEQDKLQARNNRRQQFSIGG